MKRVKTLLAIICLAVFSGASAQYVNGMDLKDLDVNYLRIYGNTNFGGNKMIVRFEFGQKVGFDHKNKNILDENGKRITFNTMIDAVNFMSSYGYRVIQTFTTVKGNAVYYHYIMEKIGLMDNKGVNSYNNTQNKHYNRIKNNNTTSSSSSNSVEKEKTNTNKKEIKEKQKPKKKGGSFLDKISGAFDKKEETPEVEEKTQAEPTKVEEYTNCTTCKSTGKINIQCTSKVCSKGKIYATCSHCSGNYKNANAQCPKCQGTGCDYCDYDGKACPNCNQGQETKTHSQCNGTGILKAVCHKCNGSGKILK